jgi:hypothetical protein
MHAMHTVPRPAPTLAALESRFEIMLKAPLWDRGMIAESIARDALAVLRNIDLRLSAVEVVANVTDCAELRRRVDQLAAVVDELVLEHG